MITPFSAHCASSGCTEAAATHGYAPAIRYTDRAKAEGFHVTLHLDAQTRTCVEEFSTSGFVGIKHAKGDAGSVTLVVPQSNNVVQSITSDSVLALARSFGWTVEQREIPWSECKDFDEVVAVGTAASLLPVRLLVRPSTGDKFIYGEITGQCTAKLTAELRRIMRGEVQDSFGWLDKVTADALL
ncbi:hypothetical protein LA080_000258 [Diaporthe eres]|nr:hypothetical protein LA080_000258 [Diaporthe eres]